MGVGVDSDEFDFMEIEIDYVVDGVDVVIVDVDDFDYGEVVLVLVYGWFLII